jgi:hypothetical protein
MRAGAIHPDLSVMIDHHEAEGRIHRGVDHRDIETMDSIDGIPVIDRGATERIGAQPDMRGPDALHIDHVGQVLHIRREEIVKMRRRRLHGGRVAYAPDLAVAGAQDVIGPVLNPRGDVCVGRAPVRRVVLVAVVFRRVVGGRDHDAVGQTLAPLAVVNEDSVGDRRGWSEGVVSLDERLDTICRQYLECGALGRAGQCVRVFSQVDRAANSLAPAIIADGLRDGEDMGLGERSAQGGPPMPAGAEDHPLSGVIHVGPARIVLAFEPGQVHQHFPGGRLACEWRDCH